MKMLYLHGINKHLKDNVFTFLNCLILLFIYFHTQNLTNIITIGGLT
jgi:hypothetical protein